MVKVGISAGLILDGSGRFQDYWKVAVNDDYVSSVVKAGGIPIVLPVVSNIEIIKEQLKSIDVLIMSGGDDVNPLEYGEEHLPKTGTPNLKRDFYDLNLVKLAREMKIPTLAICRGFQITNVAFGGTLYQDMSYIDNAKLKHDQWSLSNIGTQKITIEEGSLLHNIFDKKEVLINSFHHQAAKDVAKDMKVVAKASDGVIEAIEFLDNDTFFLAVQWHPEMMAAQNNEDMLKIFKALIESNK